MSRKQCSQWCNCFNRSLVFFCLDGRSGVYIWVHFQSETENVGLNITVATSVQATMNSQLMDISYFSQLGSIYTHFDIFRINSAAVIEKQGIGSSRKPAVISTEIVAYIYNLCYFCLAAGLNE